MEEEMNIPAPNAITIDGVMVPYHGPLNKNED